MKIKISLLSLTFCISLIAAGQIGSTKSELTILGTVHSPTLLVNADTIYSAIVKTKPDIILLELDSSFFTKSFQLKEMYDENEINATVKYLNKNKKCVLRPFDFEGRNAYRPKMGIQNSDKILKRIGIMYYTNSLSAASRDIWKRFTDLTDTIDTISKKDLQTINSIATDNLVCERQFYQYKKLKEIIKSKKEFLNNFDFTSKGDSITLEEVFNRYAYFEELRNRTMVENILKIIKQNPKKRIMVLTGFYHRDFLLTELKFKEIAYNFIIREFNQ